MPIFPKDQDRSLYLSLLVEQARRFQIAFLAYCLMPNHVHLIAVPDTEGALARAIGEAHRRYTLAVNQREGKRGYLFQGRFFSCPMDEQHLLAALRYVERNPVRAGLVMEPWDYPWSSAAFRVGLRDSDPIVTDREPLGIQTHWKEFLRQDPPEIDALRKGTRTGRPCGNESFVRQAEVFTGRRLHPLPAGRHPAQ
jgi:putative transposase